MIYKEATKCRSCQHDLKEILSLGSQKLTGIFPNVGENTQEVPVTLMKCTNQDCGLVQLKESVDPNIMYGMDYGYRTGLNKSMTDHIKKVFEDSKDWISLEKNDLFIDIGSNDGTLVNHIYKNTKGITCLGIDPTICKFGKYYDVGTHKIADFFSYNLLSIYLNKKPKAKLITSFSMFYDLEDPIFFAKEVESCLADDGIWIFEQAYLGFILNRITIDTILSEHLLYYDLQSIDYILNSSGLKIIDVELNDINAGSIRIVATKKDSCLQSYRSVDLIKNYEKIMGFNDPSMSIYKNFVTLCKNFKEDFRNFLLNADTSGKRVCALGASTKFNCILQYVDASPKYIQQIGEINDDKYGKVTPGTNIPIVPEDEVLNSNPDYIIIGCYHFKDFFLGLPKIKQYIENGGTIVFPLPTLEFYNKDS